MGERGKQWRGENGENGEKWWKNHNKLQKTIDYKEIHDGDKMLSLMQSILVIWKAGGLGKNDIASCSCSSCGLQQNYKTTPVSCHEIF